jgi:opacity protein-like surface antigen
MKKLFLCLACSFPALLIQAQKLHLTTFAGVSNYKGDLQDKKFTFKQANFAAGIGLAYEITEQLYATANVKLGKLSGDDKREIKNSTRNLTFSSPLSELQLGLEYDVFNLSERSLTPYLFAGVASFHFNPSTIDSAGNKVFLQPLGTEGQGFYNGRKKYNLTQISIPFGGGLKLALSENIRIGVEIGFRKTFTDYLDDVSTSYVDKALLLANNGQRAVDLAVRGGELKSGLTYPADGTLRGNSKRKDWYYFSGLSFSFRLGGRGGLRYGGINKTGCPANVY